MHYFSLVPTFFGWWYGRGLEDLVKFLLVCFSYLINMFSVVGILKTLFSPWKKMVSDRGKGIEGLKLWLIDNMVSRAVGFIVRLFMLIFFVVSFIVLVFFSLLALMFWIFMPLYIISSTIFIFIGYI